MIRFIENHGDYFSTAYFNEDFVSKVQAKSGFSADAVRDMAKALVPLREKFYRYKRTILEGGLRTKDKIFETHQFNTLLLQALGYDAEHTEYQHLFHLSETEVLPVRHILYRGEQAHLVVMEMQPLIKENADDEPDGLFQQRYSSENDENATQEQRYLRSQWDRVFQVPEGLKLSPSIVNAAVSTLFLLEQHRRPRYILLLAGNKVFLLEQEKWFRGAYLEFDIEEFFALVQAKRDYYNLFFLLLAKETLAPSSNPILLEQLDEDNHKSAYEVTKDLKIGVIQAVEALANEAIRYKREVQCLPVAENEILFAQQLKDDCLTMVYRLLFLFYSEAREDLHILPVTDETYARGYSLETLRDLEQVNLVSESSREGYFFHDTLTTLFTLLQNGFNEQFVEKTLHKSFKVRKLDSPLFVSNAQKLPQLFDVKIRNTVWQTIICSLSLSKLQKGKTRGRISYKNLGINQLGSVYESLLAFRGFFADQDYIEVHKAGKPQEGTFLVARSRMDDFKDDEILKTDEDKTLVLKKGSFVYRLSGRDRQKSASYYTPEVLTQCTVKYTLKAFTEQLENKEMKAADLLDLKLLEPAMGAAAFHNEMINQIAELYLTYRQAEKKDRIAPDLYRYELQKVKAYIATNNVYGVDLNPTAVELGKLSLWLNVMHVDMETPFFGSRVAVGNAVIGAWFKTFNKKDVVAQKGVKGALIAQKYWTNAPDTISFSPKGVKRKADAIYHFLLPDEAMLASAKVAIVKEDMATISKEFVNGIATWRKEMKAPVSEEDCRRLLIISTKIDELILEYYQAQCAIQRETSNREEVYGVLLDATQQRSFHLRSYEEKEKLNDLRNKIDAPYFKLKLLMDYWCALWFWDARDAEQLPKRQQFWEDVEALLGVEKNVTVNTGFEKPLTAKDLQTSLFELPKPIAQQLSFADMKDEQLSQVAENIIEYKEANDLFDNNQRFRTARELSKNYRFFHPQLEFVEVFMERGGFDVIGGNPPWLKLQFEESGIIAEKFPEVAIRNTTAPQVRDMQQKVYADAFLKKIICDEAIATECSATFLNAFQNYPLLVGQQTNLYKCVLENGFDLLNPKGYMGLLHPEGVYDDPSGQPLRKEMYQRLKFHFQFQNEFSLFAEVHHEMTYGVNVYSGKNVNINFSVINNIFHPSLIDSSFIHDGFGECVGIKAKDTQTNKFTWSIKPHKDRIVHYTEKELKIIAKTFENSLDWENARLVSIHSAKIVTILEKLSQFSTSIQTAKTRISEGFHETNDIDKLYIKEENKLPDVAANEMIYNGPHIFISNPMYKSPRVHKKLNSDYDNINHTDISEDYMPRTIYVPHPTQKADFEQLINGFFIEKNTEGINVYDNWFDYYKIGFRKMLSQAGERTLISALLPPRTSHVNGVISLILKNEKQLIEAQALCSSLVLDFFVKTVGAANLYDNRITAFPLGVSEKYHTALYLRTLLLNCLNTYYAPLWENNYAADFAAAQWSIADTRLKPFATLEATWTWQTPLRNAFERRQALVEIDVLSAMALGLTLDELILIYNVQFPVLQQNEDDTWYDSKGNIVFTCSKGLTGVGVDRPVWEQIRLLEAGATYEHTISKSELYRDKKMTYHAPFTCCNRVEDYRKAWETFKN